MNEYDVEKALLSLDIQLFSQRGSEVQGLCPLHEKRTGSVDHTPSWWINVDSGAHMCFSCGYKGNLYTLVRDIKDYDHSEIVKYLSQKSETPLDVLAQRLSELPQYVVPIEDTSMSEARLAVFVDPPATALAKRKLSLDSAHTYGVLWNDQKSSWILPLRDPLEHTLWGWQEKGSNGRFFRNYPPGVRKSKTVFGVDVMTNETLVVVESPLDALRLHTAGVTGAIATCGAILGEEQAKIMRSAQRVIAAFDTDEAGEKANDQMRGFARKYAIELFFFNYGDTSAKDPGDMEDADIHWGIEHARDVILGKAEFGVRW
jgi:CHC2 zinc finger/Toprim domain